MPQEVCIDLPGGRKLCSGSVNTEFTSGEWLRLVGADDAEQVRWGWRDWEAEPANVVAALFAMVAELEESTQELVLSLEHGFSLRTGGYDSSDVGGDYLRICDQDGREHWYWDHQEWQDNPVLVMGAIINAAAGPIANGELDEVNR